MNDESLEELLRAAAGSAGPAELRPGLAGRVRRLYRRRLRARRVLGGSVAAALLVAAALVGAVRFAGNCSTQGPPTAVATRPEEPIDVDRLRAEIAQLKAEADRRQRAVQRMLLQQRLRERQARLPAQPEQPDPWQLARIEFEKTAFLLVDEADRQNAAPAGSSRRAELYRQVIGLFPDTHWAQVARQRLDQLD